MEKREASTRFKVKLNSGPAGAKVSNDVGSGRFWRLPPEARTHPPLGEVENIFYNIYEYMLLLSPYSLLCLFSDLHCSSYFDLLSKFCTNVKRFEFSIPAFIKWF